MMWRLLHAVAIAALIASAVYVYGVKYRTIYASEQLVKTRHLIAKEKDAVNLLRAEYAHLARPDRLQALADAKLGFQPLALSQIATVEELPEVPSKGEFDRPRARNARLHEGQRRPCRSVDRRWRRNSAREMTMDETPNDADLKTARRAKSARLAPRAILALCHRSAQAVRNMAMVLTRRDALPKAARSRKRHAGPVARHVIAAFRRFVPQNFGVDLGPPAPGRPRATLRSLLTVANGKAFVRALLLTRLDRSGARIRMLALGVFAAYATLAVKLVVLGVSHDPPQTLKGVADMAVSGARPDLLDRNGEILATDVKTMSVFAEPNRIIDKDEAVELITAVLPDVDAKELRERLGSRKGFVWVKRQITPKEQAEIFHLGLPGVGFLPENKRVYPNGPIGAHVLGYVDKDNVGIAGMEKYLDEQSLTDPHVPGFAVDPESLKPVRLSLDLKATHALRDELTTGMDHFRAKAAAGMVIDVNTGEVIALESLPDYDPNQPIDAHDPTRINRINVGVYEMGSTFKALSISMALESGKVNLGSHIDARELVALRPVHYPRFPRNTSRIDGARSLHSFLEHRYGPDGADGWRRRTQGVSEEDGPA